MKVKVQRRLAVSKEIIITDEECNSVADITRIIKLVNTSVDAYVNDLHVVKHGAVEMFMYNFKKEVLLHLEGNPKELHERRNPKE